MQYRRGPATVMGERLQEYATETEVLGRFGRAMIQSQENCLYINHRLTCERWEGDLHECFSYAYFVRRVYNAPDFYVVPKYPRSTQRGYFFYLKLALQGLGRHSD